MPLMKKILLTERDEFPLLTSYPVIQTFVGPTGSSTNPNGRDFVVQYLDGTFTQGYIGTNDVIYKVGVCCTCDSNIVVATAISTNGVIVREMNKDGTVLSTNTFGLNLEGAINTSYAQCRGHLFAPYEYLSRFSSIIHVYQYDTNTIRVIYYKKGQILYKDLTFNFDSTKFQVAFQNIKQHMYSKEDAVGFFTSTGSNLYVNFVYLKYGSDPEIKTIESYEGIVHHSNGQCFVFNEDITKVLVIDYNYVKAYTLDTNKNITESYYIASNISLSGINSTFDTYLIRKGSSSSGTTYYVWFLNSAGKTQKFTGTTTTTNAMNGSISIGRTYSLFLLNTGSSSAIRTRVNWDGTTANTGVTAKLVYPIGTMIQTNLGERSPYGTSTYSGYTTYGSSGSTYTNVTNLINYGGNGVLYPTDITFY